tara:strand:- start:758 stop:931 length:174 start_codon:yes stop_codon:yes gene_type:complete
MKRKKSLYYAIISQITRGNIIIQEGIELKTNHIIVKKKKIKKNNIQGPTPNKYNILI